MKELSIEEKAKAYDDAIERAKKVHNEQKAQPFDVMLKIFPELKESEDEQHRKWILEYLYDGLRKSDEQFKGQFKCAIAWLEKQGEQKPTIIIPNFRVGDNIKTTNEEPLTITKIDEKGYWSEDLFICGFDDAAKWELVKQEPTEIRTTGYWYVEDMEQKPAEWSEEDEKVIHCLEYTVRHFYEDEDTIKWCCDWLKSLRPKKQWKPSDEQMTVLHKAISGGCYNVIPLIEIEEQLKKLRK